MGANLKNLDLACLVIVLSITVGCGSILGFRIAKEYRRIQFENEIFIKKIKDLSLAESMLVQVRGVLRKTRDELNLMNERIPETQQSGALLKKLDTHARQRNIKIASMQQHSTEKLKRYTRIPLQLKFEGRFEDIYRVIGDFETMNRIFITDRLVITRTTPDATCQAELGASVFQR